MREFSLERNISFDGDGVEMFPMNEETSSCVMKMLAVISALSIMGVNIPIITTISRGKEWTFINLMVLLDCVDAVAHIPILCQYFL